MALVRQRMALVHQQMLMHQQMKTQTIGPLPPIANFSAWRAGLRKRRSTSSRCAARATT